MQDGHSELGPNISGELWAVWGFSLGSALVQLIQDVGSAVGSQTDAKVVRTLEKTLRRKRAITSCSLSYDIRWPMLSLHMQEASNHEAAIRDLHNLHQVFPLSAQVLLLHPGTGSPGFAEVPHMGSALTGASPGWGEAAEQLVKRVNWDLGNEAVEFSALDQAVRSMIEQKSL